VFKNRSSVEQNNLNQAELWLARVCNACLDFCTRYRHAPADTFKRLSVSGFTATDLVVKAGMACERVANAPEQLNALGWGAFVTRALTSARVTDTRQQIFPNGFQSRVLRPPTLW